MKVIPPRNAPSMKASPSQGKKRKREEFVRFVLFVYNSADNRDCMFNTIMNITQNPVFSRHFFTEIMPEEVLDSNGGTEVTNERTLINALISYGAISGPSGSRRIPNDLHDDTRVDNYVKYFDGRFEENIPLFNDLIREAKFIILHFTLVFLSNIPDDYHFVPVLKVGEDWIIMGGERGSRMVSIHSDDLGNMLFSREGRELIREHCNRPWRTTAVLDFTNAAICIVPLHCGPRSRMDYTGMTKGEVNRVIGWPILNNTSSRLEKDHGFVVQMEQEMTRLEL